MKLKAVIYPLLICCILTGCADSSGQDRSFSDLVLSYQFEKIDIDKIDHVTLTVNPPYITETLTQGQVEEMVSLMENIVLNERDDTYNEYNGQWVEFGISYADGKETKIAVYSPFIIIDDTGYTTSYEPCQALNEFANSIING